MALKPCLECGVPSAGSRCSAHTYRNGSTRSWRTTRAKILERDEHRCQQCGRPGDEVDHITPLVDGGSDRETNLRTLCHDCHAAR